MQGTESVSEADPTAESVSIHLDESTVHICRAHSTCDYSGQAHPGPDCDRRYIYGVGASVLESNADRKKMESRLDQLRARLEVRNGVALARNATKFARNGWHSTDDPPEYADPLLFELDLGGNFKGHVRYTICDSRIDGGELAKL